MSRCGCENPTELRITGEPLQRKSGNPKLRLRCADCGGKVAFIPASWLSEIPGLSMSNVREPHGLAEQEQKTITIDLL